MYGTVHTSKGQSSAPSELFVSLPEIYGQVSSSTGRQRLRQNLQLTIRNKNTYIGSTNQPLDISLRYMYNEYTFPLYIRYTNATQMYIMILIVQRSSYQILHCCWTFGKERNGSYGSGDEIIENVQSEFHKIRQCLIYRR